MRFSFLSCLLLSSCLCLSCLCQAADLKLDERAAIESEWGYRPFEGGTCEVNPPHFVWRPQTGIVRWELQCATDAKFSDIVYQNDSMDLTVHTPPTSFDPRDYVWRYRGWTKTGESTNWSQPRSFSISADAARMPMPIREELLSRIPAGHPRLFVRPEQVPRLRELASGSMKADFEDLVRRCDQILKDPPPTAEPPLYGPDVKPKSEEWIGIWWGNRTYTSHALNSAATLAFTRLIGGKEEYGQVAKRILMDCAQWDPKGATGYRYNDEAGMPYAYYFSRTYTFVNDLLSEQEKQQCRDVMRVRGEEMYDHLCPRHLWNPYSSHSNRAWHFLGEIGLAFHGEIDQADDWVWFATNVFYNVYPVWSDADGGWHEGTLYWNSYIGRFTWWADIMQAALDINAFDHPYFDRVGYYPMYLLPPGKVGGGFGDLNAKATSAKQIALMSVLAAQSRNPYWQWYVDQHDEKSLASGYAASSGYLGFLRGSRGTVAAKSPADLPSSRLFRGTGQAYLNTTIEDANQDVQVVFKSSPFGTQSHGYEANNSFLLWAFGQRLLIRSGYRDTYGSEHHRDWMWSTRSVNNITVDGKGQLPHAAAARGRVVDFQTTPAIDVVVGEAGAAYRSSQSTGEQRLLDRFTRAILFIKPDMIVVYDRLRAPKPSQYTYWLHAINDFQVHNPQDITIEAGDVRCQVQFLAPDGLQLSQTDQYDPNPRDRVELREWHLTADTADKSKSTEFVTLYRPYREGEETPVQGALQAMEGGYVLTSEVAGGRVVVLLPNDDQTQLSFEGLETQDKIIVQLYNDQGEVLQTTEVAME
ncbi:DUF4962 domain-containing protein [Novipirellula artificiosorum]|nr:DUF4962 domain-containing protein [Novipirellula artificiosorum]